jgi:hypothetical protein
MLKTMVLAMGLYRVRGIFREGRDVTAATLGKRSRTTGAFPPEPSRAVSWNGRRLAANGAQRALPVAVTSKLLLLFSTTARKTASQPASPAAYLDLPVSDTALHLLLDLALFRPQLCCPPTRPIFHAPDRGRRDARTHALAPADPTPALWSVYLHSCLFAFPVLRRHAAREVSSCSLLARSLLA